MESYLKEFNQSIKSILSQRVNQEDKLWLLLRALKEFSENFDSFSDAIKTKVIDDIKDRIEKTHDDVSIGIVTRVVRNMLKDMRGDQGPQGLRGPEGKQGESVIGPAGPMGPKPVMGKDYPRPKDGRDGKDGVQGQMGEVGPQGLPGKDGSPDLPDQIIKKINLATKKIKQGAIEGLMDELEVVKRKVKELDYRGTKRGVTAKGGGMGDVLHEVKNVSSATTTIATNRQIAGGGAALWVRYQGQNIDYGVHYTVGGDRQTITLTFTPSDNTTIEITYIAG